jgi:filamentous hemagglutinin
MANKYWVGPSGGLTTAGHWSTSSGAASFTGTRPTGINALLTVTLVNGGSIGSGQLLYDSGGVARGTIGTQVSGTAGGVGIYNTTAASASLSGTLYTIAAGSSTTAPGSGDIVIFDNNSFFGTAVSVNVPSTTTISGIDASGITSGANGITLTGTSQLTLGGGSGTLLILPSSRFTWSHSGILGVTGAGTFTTNGTSITSAVSLSGSASLTLTGDFNGTNSFTFNAGTVNLSTYQWICSSFVGTITSTATLNCSAGGGLTMTGNSGTIINLTKSSSQLVFGATKPTFTLTASGTAANRDITWTGAGWATNTSTMPIFKITNGNDTVTINQATATYSNVAALNTTGFTGSLGWTGPTNILIFGDIISPACALNAAGEFQLYGTGNIFSVNTPSSTVFRFAVTSVYTQSGNIKATMALLNPATSFTTGSFTLNNTGTVSGLNVSTVTLVGDINFVEGFNSTIKNPIITSLTSITKTGTSGTDSFTIDGGTYGSGIPITFSGTTGGVSFLNTTINGTLTLSSLGGLTIQNSTIANTLTVSATSLSLTGTVNIPSASVISLSGSYSAIGPTFTNKFRVNINGSAGSIYANGSGGNDPDFYITGSGAIQFEDGSSVYTLYCSSLDVSGFTGTISSSVPDTIYVKNSLTGSSSGPQLPTVKLYASATGSFTLNSCNIYGFSSNTSTQAISLGSSSIVVSADGFSVTSGTLNAGTSTLTINGATVNVSSQNLYNVVVASGSNNITTPQINSISNTTQPVTVNFGSNATIGTFNLNGTAGNLVTVGSTAAAQRTLTKGSAWTLANSTDGGNNTGLTFGATGNNSYLSVSYINGVVLATATGNMFLMF